MPPVPIITNDAWSHPAINYVIHMVLASVSAVAIVFAAMALMLRSPGFAKQVTRRLDLISDRQENRTATSSIILSCVIHTS